MSKSIVTGSASAAPVFSIAGAAALMLLSDEDIPTSPRNAHEYSAMAEFLQTEGL